MSFSSRGGHRHHMEKNMWTLLIMRDDSFWSDAANNQPVISRRASFKLKKIMKNSLLTKTY